MVLPSLLCPSFLSVSLSVSLCLSLSLCLSSFPLRDVVSPTPFFLLLIFPLNTLKGNKNVLSRLLKSSWFRSVYWSSPNTHTVRLHPQVHKYLHARATVFFAYSSFFSSLPLCPPKSFCLFKSNSCLILQASLSSLSRPQILLLLWSSESIYFCAIQHETNHCLDLFSHSASFPEKIHDTPRAKMSPPLQIMPLSCLRISGGPLWPIALLP